MTGMPQNVPARILDPEAVRARTSSDTWACRGLEVWKLNGAVKQDIWD